MDHREGLHMKRFLLLAMAMLTTLGGARAVERGATPEAVRAELGEPAGLLLLGARMLYTYDRGEVEFYSNVVVRAELLTAEAFEQRRIARAAEAERQRAWADALRAARIVEGQQVLANLRADPSFAYRPASEQVAYWRSFRQLYPEMAVEQEYADALRRLELDERERRVAQAENRRIAELEERVADAEDRARQAERRSLQRSSAVDYGYGYGYGYRYPVCYPVVVNRAPCPAPERARESIRVEPTITVTLRNSASLARNSAELVRGNAELVRD